MLSGFSHMLTLVHVYLLSHWCHWHNHDVEATEFFKTFDNRLVNNPYKIAFGDENHTCTVADWTVTMKGPMKSTDGKMIQPTGKTARLEFCTVATWKNGEIVEERLFYDVVGFMKQLGLS
jgi:hypothetical protein